jgi:hypothetical protein
MATVGHAKLAESTCQHVFLPKKQDKKLLEQVQHKSSQGISHLYADSL